MKLLIICGGGVYGYIPAKFLNDYDEAINGIQLADGFGGTSVGGILTMMYNYGYTTKQVYKLFTDLCSTAFSNSSIWSKFKPYGPRYDGVNIENSLKKIFGEDGFGRQVKPIIIPTINFKHNNPKIFDNIIDDDDKKYKCWEIARMTSAAPTYFPPYGDYIDGGLIANNPVVLTITAFHHKLKIPYSEMDVFVMGTGSLMDPNRNMKSVSKWGTLRWVSPLVDYLTKANEMCADFVASQMGLKSYKFFNPIKFEDKNDIDDVSILKTLDKSINNHKEEFNKEFFKFLRR